ncbi:hypothetical protein PWO45_09910 [Bacillus amyloliquefaciens]|uniref:hypothetical protein n=1 Tax=Bacillus amyloliquefaciens group TaxID=1938374 RepID=UPI000DE81017|nr:MULTISPECIES: hypothetical protein [Bacillus amyloliquefaciens group]MDE5154297.1 hypothetical protein [Bacillus amyloliquefaciens]RBY99950.1 hypothetical protein DSD26_10700 [Bacillus velezensis]
MYFIETQEELIGKEVAYVWANQFCEQTTIITKDGGVFMVCQQTDWDDGYETRILYPHEAKKILHPLKRDLYEKGVINESEWEKYENELKKKQVVEREKYLKEQEEREHKRYEELKAKFEQ